jgi:hypothetical protein
LIILNLYKLSLELINKLNLESSDKLLQTDSEGNLELVDNDLL